MYPEMNRVLCARHTYFSCRYVQTIAFLTWTSALTKTFYDMLGNARALAEDGRPRSVSPFHTPGGTADTTLADVSIDVGNASSASLTPNTPSSTSGYKRLSLGPGGTSKVLSDLQTAAVQARTALDNTRAQLRLSQRSVGSVCASPLSSCGLEH